ncbi:MAG: PD-(D/E)XK nuclease family protein [Gammaproteobacteria bacterium]
MRVKLDLSNIQANDTIIVANNRQALAFKRTIIEQFGAIKMPKIYSYSAFLKKTWSQLNPQESLRLLSDYEFRLLFSEFINDSAVQNPSAVTDEAIKCYRLMKTHFISKEKIINYHSSLGSLFVNWIDKLSQVKKQSQFIDSSDLFLEISRALEGLISAGNYYHYGIKKPTPEQSKLFNLLQSQELKAAQANEVCKAISYPTIEAELQCIAEWSREKSSSNPLHQIAVVIPNLGELQHKVSSIFDEVFDCHATETQQKPFNISLGNSLSQYPLIRHLFKVIGLSNEIMRGSVELDSLCQVIPSPYIKGANIEANNRSLLINRLLGRGKSSFSTKRLIALMADCPILKEQILSISQIKSKQRASSEDWLQSLYQLLDIWAFGSDRALSSGEYQLFEKFQNESLILNQNPVFKRQMTFEECIDLLRRHFDAVIFQPQSGDANIHILGALEAEGLHFDAVWASNMTSDFLPGVVKFPLFIPANVCREFHLPSSTFDLIQTNAISTLNELKGLSGNINFSFAETNDGREQIATPLLDFEPCTENAVITPQNLALITVKDACAPRLKNSTIKQGVQTLQDQMSCSFKGFVRRLKIQEFESDHLGFDRAEQGVLIHKILETLFTEISTAKALKELSDESINRLIEFHTMSAIGAIEQNYQVIEKDRIARVIKQYLALEKQRLDFEVVATESVVDVCIEGLSFTTKLDRMDQLANGDRLIIDYKTGQSALSQITGEVIEQAQLPIYAISNEVNGVAFAQINASECVFKTVARDREILPSSKQAQTKMPDWDEQLNTWRETLSKASLSFQQGVADVLPEKNACNYCDYDLLCRVEKTLGHG